MSIITTNNKKICFEAKGDPKNPVVICVMGVAGQLVHWPKALIVGLVEAGFYVITFDNRDVGLSSYYDQLKTPPLSEALSVLKTGKTFKPPYTLQDMSEDIIDLMNGLSIKKAHLLGISMGGQIAQLFAINHPERLLSLTLIATTSREPGLPEPEQAVLDFFFRPKKSDDLEADLQAHIEQYKLYHHPDDFDLDAVTKMHQAAYKRAYHPAGNQRQLLAMMIAAPVGEQLKTVTVPTLVIHGDCDPVVSVAHGEQLAAVIPNAHLEVIEKMGHGMTPKIATKIADIFWSYFLNDYIELESYNENWPKLAEAEIKLLLEQLSAEHIIDIQHVGSTAIPGTPAKPIIDIQMAADNLEGFVKTNLSTLNKLGYVFWDKNPDKTRLFFVKGMPPYGDKRTHHLHVVKPDSHHWKNKLLFRDYLRMHPEVTNEYKALKLYLAKRYKYDREQYTDEKTTFIKSVLQKTQIEQL